jgi:hypothetical protein
MFARVGHGPGVDRLEVEIGVGARLRVQRAVLDPHPRLGHHRPGSFQLYLDLGAQVEHDL